MKVSEKDREAMAGVFANLARAHDEMWAILASSDAAAYRRGLEDAAKRVESEWEGEMVQYIAAAIRKLGEDA